MPLNVASKTSRVFELPRRLLRSLAIFGIIYGTRRVVLAIGTVERDERKKLGSDLAGTRAVSIEVDEEKISWGYNSFSKWVEGCCFCERGNVGVIACTQRSDSLGEVSGVQLAARLGVEVAVR